MARLESELSVMEKAREKQERLVEVMETRLGEVTTAGLEAIIEAEERKERRAQETVLDLNNKYNKVENTLVPESLSASDYL